jgi:hypothetical protein
MSQPAAVCLATVTVAARLMIRPATPGKPVAWPMLVADPCPWAAPAVFRFLQPGTIVTHAHVHYMTEPGPWLRHAPCNRRPYLLTVNPLAAAPALPQPAAPARPVIEPLPPAAAIRPQPSPRRYGPPDAITALQRAGHKVAWNWVTGRYTLDGEPVTADGLDAAAAALPPLPYGWAIDPRATGSCPSCTGPTADGLCLKCRWAAALAGTTA